MPIKPVFSRAPLIDEKYSPLPLTAVLPKGSLLRSLQAEAEQFVTMPWLNWMLESAIPLAFLTGHEALRKQVDHHVEELLKSQREDGSSDPLVEEWIPITQCRGLMQYYRALGDKRVLVFVLKFFHYTYTHFDSIFNNVYNASITGDYVDIAIQLYAMTGKPFLLKLIEKLRAAGFDWTSYFHTFAMPQPFSKKVPNEEMQKGLLSEDEDTRLYYERQYNFAKGIRVAMALKTPVLLSRFSGSSKERDASGMGLHNIMRYHGVPNGLFTADELLAGQNPSCGTDTRVIGDTMMSLEHIFRVADTPIFVDLWEKLAFCALPASRTKGTVRKLIQVNQTQEDPVPAKTLDPATASRLEFGSWTGAFLKGLTRFASTIWMAAPNDGLALMSYLPSTVRWKVNDTLIAFTVESEYPHKGEINISVRSKAPVKLPLHLRIPDWAKEASVQINDEDAIFPESCSFLILDRTWNEGDRIHVSLPMKPRISQWYHRGVAVEYGPVLMALPVTCGGDDWNYGLLVNKPLSAEVGHEDTHDWKIKVTAYFKKVPQWEMKGKAPASPPVLPFSDEPEEKLTLVPYGTTTCRIAQFPQVQEH